MNKKTKRTPSLNLATFRRSILEALSCNCDFETSVRRLRGRISNITPGTLYVRRTKSNVWFYERKQSSETYLRKSENRIYELAQKEYMEKLIEVLQLRRKFDFDHEFFASAFEEMIDLLETFEFGKLDISRIVYSPKQYAWFNSPRHRKLLHNSAYDVDDSRITSRGVHVRSKSEKAIADALESYGVNYIYESKFVINVQPFVDSLCVELQKAGIPASKKPYYYSNGVCYWSVPSCFDFMNLPGSLWHTYDARSGTVTIYPDFTIMLNDGSLFVWEHDGLIDQTAYRSNAGERLFAMNVCSSLSRENILTSYEKDITDAKALQSLVMNYVLKRLWF